MPGSPTITVELFPQDTTNPANKLADLTFASSVEYVEGERQTGDGRVTLPLAETNTNIAASDAPRVVRIRRAGDTLDKGFEFYVQRMSRSLSDEEGGVIVLAGPGTRVALSAALVEPYGDCLPTEAVTQRILGYQDPNFPKAGLPGVNTYGPFRHQQTLNYFGDPTVRADGMADPAAQFITNGTGAQLPGEVLYFSPVFSVDEEGTYIMQMCADDEYDAFLVGMQIGSARGKYQWKEVDNYVVNLCPGIAYYWVIRGNNLSTPYDGTDGNIHWVIGSIVPASADGEPLANNEVWRIATDAESGSFTLRPLFSTDTATILFDDSATDVQTKLEALQGVGAGNVTVSGQGTSSKNDVYELFIDGGATGTTTPVIDSQPGSAIAPGNTPAQVEAAFEAASTVANVTCNTGTGVSGDPWIVAFDGASAETSFSVSMDDTNLSGGGSNLNQISTGTPYDPWTVEFVGVLGFFNTGEPDIDGSGLVGGSVEFDRDEGDSATGIIRTDLNWTYIEYPSTPRGLTAGRMIRIVIDEAVARGNTILSLLTLDFDDFVDSSGNPWSTEYELAVSPYNTRVSDVVEFLEMSGLKVRMAPGYVLEVNQTLGQDLTATVDISDAHLGADSQWAVDKEVANVLYSETNEGSYVKAPDNPSIAIHGRWEEPYSAPDGPELTVGSWQQLALQTSADPYAESTFITVPEDHPDGTSDQTPIDDYVWGDTIVAQTIRGVPADFYVTGHGLRVKDENAAVEYVTVGTEVT